MRLQLIGLGLTFLAACAQQVPDSGYSPTREQQMRDAALAGLPAPSAVEEAELDTGSTTPADTAAVDQGNMFNNPGLSDEQDFSAVSDRQSIESDAARLERNRSLYTVIEPTAIPRRPGTQIPNIVAYAISTNNPVGVALYDRGIFATEGRFQRNCAKYQSDAAAQEAFLANGGPEKDRQGLDPDGDGFACYWDPKPFRLAVRR